MVRLDPIRLVPFDLAWRASFEEQRQPFELAPGSSPVLPVEHIESTPVPPIAAKPIVDMLAVVSDIDLVDQQSVTGTGRIRAPEPDDDVEYRRGKSNVIELVLDESRSE